MREEKNNIFDIFNKEKIFVAREESPRGNSSTVPWYLSFLALVEYKHDVGQSKNRF